MANLRDIRRRIKSVKNTSQITRAMQMVASAKMRRAQDQAVKGREYIKAIANVLHHLQDEIDEEASPFLQAAEGDGDPLVLLVNTDRGLCGGLNINLFKHTREKAPENAHYITIGRKLNVTLAKVGATLDATWSIGDPLSLVELKPIFDFIVERYLDRTYGSVYIAFSGYVNTMVQRPVFKKLLPISTQELETVIKEEIQTASAKPQPRFILEPDANTLLNTILPLYVFYGLVQIVLEARASEHSARMVAMKAATENAKGLIDSLTLDYNKARQAQITNELLEITTAMKAME